MRKFKTIMIAIVAAFTIAGMSNVGAAAGSVAGSTANPHTFTITRTVTHAKNAITNTFGYTITANENNPKVPGTQTSGVSGAPTTASVVMTGVTPDANTGTATQTGTIDFSGATFTVNGDYTWTLTENSSNDSTNYPVDPASNHTYTIKASVRNAHGTGLSQDEGKQVTFFVLDKNGQKLDLTEDQILFTSETQYSTITISKTVTGAMADVDKYFTVNVTINGSGTYSVSGSHNNTSTITAGTETPLTLKHGETITIGAGANGNGTAEIPQNTTYSFEEDDYTNYIPTINSGEAGTETSGTITVGSNASANTIVNNYEGSTVTGAFLKVLPYVVIAAIAVAGIVYLVIRNKKQKEVEE